MTRVLSLLSVFVLVASAAFAQAPAPPAPQKISLATGLQRGYANIKLNLTEMSTKMSDADYMFQPTKDVRTFGQLMGHAANAQFNACSVAKGEANPNQGNDNEKKSSKAEFVKALADSFAYCDGAFAALTDSSAVEFVKWARTRWRGPCRWPTSMPTATRSTERPCRTSGSRDWCRRPRSAPRGSRRSETAGLGLEFLRKPQAHSADQ